MAKGHSISKPWPPLKILTRTYTPLKLAATIKTPLNFRTKNKAKISVCFRVSVFPSLFFLLMSLKFLLVLKCFNGVSMVFQGRLKYVWSLKEVSRMFQTKVLRVFTESFRGVYRNFSGCFKEVFRVFQGSFRKFPGCFEKVSRVFQNLEFWYPILFC